MKGLHQAYELHKLQEGFIVTSDEEIKHKETWYNPMTADIGINWHEKGIPKEWSKTLKVIAQQDQIDFSFLSKEEQKEIGWFDIEKLAKEMLPDDSDWQRRFDIIKGFQKAQELLSDRRFTLDDVLKIADKYHNIMCLYGNVKGIEYLQSLSQPKSWKVEIETFCGTEDCNFFGFHKYEGCKHTELQQPKLTKGKIKILKLL
jgi:hypothetical protein